MRVPLLLLFVAVLRGQGTVEGKVLDSSTRAGIAGLAVNLSAQSRHYDSTTDSTGAFIIRDVPAGTYSIYFVTPDYDTNDEGRGNATIQVVTNQTARPVFTLAPWPSISGRVTDPEGNALASAKVYLRDPRGETPGAIESASDGSFTFKGLRAGTYTLSARPSKPAPSGEFQVVETFFPNAVDVEQASRVALQAGTKANGYTISLQRVRVFSIRGRVADPEGRPAAKVNVFLGKRAAPKSMPGSLGNILFFQPGAEGLNPDSGDLETVVTADNGTFTFTGVREGAWLLQAESEWIRIEGTDIDVQHVGFADALVSRRDASDVEIRLAKTFDLRAKVEIEGETSPPSNVSLILRPDVRGRFSFGMQDEKDGRSVRFSQVVPGRYTISTGGFNAISGLRLAAVYLGSQNVSGITIDLTETSAPMRVVFKKGLGTLEGMLNGSAPAIVMALPADQAADPIIVAIDAIPGSRFQIPSLPPGNYIVAAFDRLDSANLFDPATFQELRRLGSLIKVEADATASIDLRPNPWPATF